MSQPIKGRIVRNTTKENQRTLSQAGSISIGEKVATKSGKERPAAIDYFKCNSSNKAYEDMFYAAYGDKPTTIKIIFMSNDINETCPNVLELRDVQGSYVGSGDGQNFEVVTKPDAYGKVSIEKWTLEMINQHPAFGSPEIFMQKVAAKYGTEWREVLRLRFLILGLNVLGYWQLVTFAKESSIPQITATIDAVMQMAGRITSIPFDLSVKMVKSDKSGAKSKYPVMSLICNLGQESLELVQKMNPTNLILTAENLQHQKSLQLEASKDKSSSANQDFTHCEEVK